MAAGSAVGFACAQPAFMSFASGVRARHINGGLCAPPGASAGLQSWPSSFVLGDSNPHRLMPVRPPIAGFSRSAAGAGAGVRQVANAMIVLASKKTAQARNNFKRGEMMRGGYRPGAGAPRGNVNAIRNGRYCRRWLIREELHPRDHQDLVFEIRRVLQHRAARTPRGR